MTELHLFLLFIIYFICSSDCFICTCQVARQVASAVKLTLEVLDFIASSILNEYFS